MMWGAKAQLREELGRMKDERNSYADLARRRRVKSEELKIEVAALGSQLSALQGRCDRAELELDRTKADFHELVLITAGRVPPRLGQPLLDVDPFAEDEKQLEVFLTPRAEETGDVIEDVWQKLDEPHDRA